MEHKTYHTDCGYCEFACHCPEHDVIGNEHVMAAAGHAAIACVDCAEIDASFEGAAFEVAQNIVDAIAAGRPTY